jgi:phosphoenolpyruvate-protein phosphotransferase
MARPLRGIAGSAGAARGPAYHYRREAPEAPLLEQAEALTHFAQAQAHVALRMRGLSDAERAAGRDEVAQLFDFMELLSEDPAFVDRVTSAVRQGAPLTEAITAAVAGMAAELAQLDSPYHRERAADILALGRAFSDEFTAQTAAPLQPPAGSILIADDLTPAEIVESASRIAGFVTRAGGATGHLIILARSHGIPAVVGVGAQIQEIPDLAEIALDGEQALVWVSPSPDQLRQLIERRAPATQPPALRGPCRLTDGHAVALMANISHPREVDAALKHGAEGVGLLRSEFLFVDRSELPDEEEQYQSYREALDRLAGRALVVRTLDIGGDKPLGNLKFPHEPNPALGMRGLRYFMHHPALLQAQLRALLRAAAHGDLRIMLPMVTTVDDLLWAREQLASASAALASLGHMAPAHVALGAMVETPAAALTVDLLAPLVDFFSVGTNDLAQYTLAADRAAAGHVGSYPLDSPAVLRLIKLAAEAARRAGRPIAVCGELAGMPSIAPLLVGLGIHELSMNPPAIAAVAEQLAAYSLADLQALAVQALG